MKTRQDTQSETLRYCTTRHGELALCCFLRLMLFDLFCRFMGFVYMPARRPNMIRGVASYELRQEFCFSDGIRPCDPVSGHGMTVFFGLLRRYAPRNDVLRLYAVLRLPRFARNEGFERV